MKIRLGFVSNSSSASYIITVQKNFPSMEQFLVELYRVGFWMFAPLEAEWIDSRNDFLQRKKPEPVAEDDQSLRNLWEVSSYAADEKRFKNGEVYFPTDPVKFLTDYKAIVKAMKETLKRIGITVKVNQGKMEIIGWTSMHNSYGDMPPIISELYFTYLTDLGGATFRREDDN